MKKIVIGWIILTLSLFAELHYTAKGTLVGKIADIRVTHTESAKRYSIAIDIVSTGVAKMMSGAQVEHHSSKGRVVKGEYHASEYIIEKRYKDIHYKRIYRFDYKRKKITKISTKWKKGKQLYRIEHTLNYFAHNDILTLYHNIMRLKAAGKSGTHAIMLAGAEKEKGKLRFVIPKAKTLKQMQKRLGWEGLDVVTLQLNRSFLSGGKGTLSFGIDKNGITQKGILDRLKVLGKVTLKRIK